VLRLGWNPNASTPSLIDRLFRRREAAAKTPPPPPPSLPAQPAIDTVSLDDEEETAADPPSVVDAVEPDAAPAP